MAAPGPCPPEGCPPPTEIDCIVVDKVYDSCTQTLTTTQTFLAPTSCTAISGCSIDLASTTCTVGSISPSAAPNYSDITFVVGVPYTVTCTNGASTSETAYLTTVIPLYNPTGTTPSCTVLSGSCNCVVLPNDYVSCTITVCVLFQVTAYVQILVPTYGFCTPPTCMAGPVLPCPPSSLFPPQMS